MSFERRTNKELKMYGGVNYRGDNNFRLVWSDDQFEVRKGNFNEFYGKIFIRSFSGIQRVKKYPLIKSRWVLEKYIPASQCQFPDLPVARSEGSYEPVYVFDNNGEELPFNMDVCRLIISKLNNPVAKSKIIAMEEAKAEKEEKDFEQFAKDMIGGEHSDIADRLKHHEAVFIASK